MYAMSGSRGREGRGDSAAAGHWWLQYALTALCHLQIQSTHVLNPMRSTITAAGPAPSAGVSNLLCLSHQNAAHAAHGSTPQVRRQVDEPLGSLFHPRRAAHPLHAAFRTLDATSYADIATVPVDRVVLDLAVGYDTNARVSYVVSLNNAIAEGYSVIGPVDRVMLDRVSDQD